MRGLAPGNTPGAFYVLGVERRKGGDELKAPPGVQDPSDRARVAIETAIRAVRDGKPTTVGCRVLWFLSRALGHVERAIKVLKR